jgi:hypothetical protein
MSYLERLVEGLKHNLEDIELWKSFDSVTEHRDDGVVEDLQAKMIEHATNMAEWYRRAIIAWIGRGEDE